MSNINLCENSEVFCVKQPQETSYLYFPLSAADGLKSAITPTFSGDAKLDQNHFLLQPTSVEDLQESQVARSFWLQMEDRDVWCVTGNSAGDHLERVVGKESTGTVLTAGYMWQEVQREYKKGGLVAKILSFVPIQAPGTEVMQVTLENTASEKITFTPFGAIPIYGRSADNLRDHRHVTSLLHRITVRDGGVYVAPTLSFDERGHKKADHTYYVCGVTGQGEKPVRFYPTIGSFVGEGGCLLAPAAVYKDLGGVQEGYRIDGEEAMGAFAFATKTLMPGEKMVYLIFAGVQGREEENTILDTLGTEEKLQKAFEETKRYWKEQVNIEVHTADGKFDHFMRWVAFQPILRRIYGCSFLPHHDYGKGGRGYRDLWQDLLALLLLDAKQVRPLLLSNFGGVRMDGTNATIIGTKPGEFVADRNNIVRVWMDHGVWPLKTCATYIHQTGDVEFLLEENTYFKDKQCKRGTDIDVTFRESEVPVQKCADGTAYKGSVLEHLLVQHLTAFYEVGDHGHLRLRGADWNDALDMAPEKGESVAFTAAYAGNLDILADLIDLLAKRGIKNIALAKEMQRLLVDKEAFYEDICGKRALLNAYGESCRDAISGDKVQIPATELTDILRKMAQWMKAHIRRTEWIEEGTAGWFNSYYDNKGRRVERIATEGEPCRMMLTGQVFTIMSGTATAEQVEQIVKSADAHLYEEKKGGYKLNTDFGELKTDLGRMFGFAYGHKENGAVFSHMTTMYGNALYQRGFVKEGYKALSTLYRQAMDFENSKIYPGIPEYFDGNGRGLYHYLTGAASWYLMTVVQEMFGVQKVAGKLALSPKLMAEQFDHKGEASIRLVMDGQPMTIVYKNEKHKEYGEYTIKTIEESDSQQGKELRVTLD